MILRIRKGDRNDNSNMGTAGKLTCNYDRRKMICVQWKPSRPITSGSPSRVISSATESTGSEGTKPIHIELACFREKMAERMPRNLGGVGPSWHFKAIALSLWPEESVSGNPHFIWNSWADRMLRAACKYRYLAIAGSGGFGKSEFFAIWLIVNFLCDPANTICLATSITVSVSKKKLWGKVVTFWTPLEKLGFPGKLVDSLHIIRYVDENGVPIKGDLAGIALVVGERKKEKEAVGRLAWHPPRAGHFRR